MSSIINKWNISAKFNTESVVRVIYTLVMLNCGPYVRVSGAYIAAAISFLFAYCHLCPCDMCLHGKVRNVLSALQIFLLISFKHFFSITISEIS